MMQTRRLDLHLHSSASDGTDSPKELAAKIREGGFSVFALTDHDTYKGCDEIAPLISGDPELHFIYGIEFSCRDDRGKYHILGYGFDPRSRAISELVERTHENRLFKARARFAFLEEHFGFKFTEGDKREFFSNLNPGKPHLGNLLARKGYARDRNDAIYNYINRSKVRSPYIGPKTAIEAIRGAGGIPVLAHPIFGDGGQNLGAEELAERVDRLMGCGLAGLECYYSRHTAEQRDFLLKMASDRGLYVSAGSDYHGGNKKVRLGETGLTEDMEPADGLLRLLEVLT